MRTTSRLSVIVPTLNEAEILRDHLGHLQALRHRGHEVIVADGGSVDGTRVLAEGLADRILTAPRGRGSQMNAGAAVATGEVLLFLHADTRLPADADRFILDALVGGEGWGRFDVAIHGSHPLLAVIAWSMNRRSRLTGIATGDQAMFVTRDRFRDSGGFPDIALMEDIALSRILKTHGRPRCLTERVVTSGRRWERSGVLRILFEMWGLRLAYFLGVDPSDLARRYGYEPRQP